MTNEEIKLLKNFITWQSLPFVDNLFTHEDDIIKKFDEWLRLNVGSDDRMTLDEAIKREENLAYSYGERYKRGGEPVGELDKLEAEHKQMAEWLRELKAYREARNEITRTMNSGQWSESVVYGLDKAVRIMKKHLREVNADDKSRD